MHSHERMLSKRLIMLMGMLLPFLLSGFLSQAFGSGTSIVESASCSSFNLGGNVSGDSGDSTSSTALDSSYPVDIPIPLAKGQNGVEPSSLHISGSSSINSTLTIESLMATTNVTLAGETIDATSGATVALVEDGAVTQTTTTTAGGSFQFSITSIGSAGALVVCTDGACETGSEPILFLVENDAEAGVVLHVFTSNISADISDSSLAYTIVNSLSNNGVDFVIPLTKLSENTPFLGRQSLSGGTLEVIEELDEFIVKFLHYFPQVDETIGIHEKIDTIISIDDDFNTTVSDSETFPNRQNVDISLDGQYRMVAHYQDPSSPQTSVMMVGISKIGTGQKNGIIPAGETNNINTLEPVFLGDELHMAVIKNYKDGTSALQHYILSSLSGNASILTPTVATWATSSNRMGNLVHHLATDNLIFRCENNQGLAELCVYTMASQTLVTRVPNKMINKFHVSETANLVVMEVDVNNDDLNGDDTDDTNARIASWDDNYLYLLDLNTNLVSPLRKGLTPTFHPTNSNIITHTGFINGTIQLGIINRAN